METWKPVLGNDAYEVSDLGRVRSINPNRKTFLNGLKLGVGGGGYIRVRLAPNPRKHMSVHRMVWEAFNGSIPVGLTINHLNGTKADNRLSNLEVCSRSENIQHAMRTGLFDPKVKHISGPHILFGEDNPSAKLTAEIARKIRELKTDGMRGAKIARHLGLKERTVYHVLARDYWADT